MYDPSYDHELLERIRALHELAIENNEEFRQTYKGQFDQGACVTRFYEGQRVLLYEPENLNSAFGRKMRQPFVGPYEIGWMRGKVVNLR